MTTILDAATSENIEQAAMRYIEAGCSIIPLAGKRPANSIKNWTVFAHTLPSRELVRRWLRYSIMRNGIGIIGGAVSGGLVLLDVDSMEACDEFEATFPRLIDTLTVRSGSGRGKHYYFYADQLPGNAYRGGVELRCTGAYVVAPPSVHPISGQRYRVERHDDVRREQDMAAIRHWILNRGAAGEAAPRRAPSPLPPSTRDASAYGRAALAGECAAVRAAMEGSANGTLYRAALKMGSLIAAGKISRNECEYQLEAAAAALSARDGEEATRRTIASGLGTGFRNGDTRRSVR